jgi:hypothetical protein
MRFEIADLYCDECDAAIHPFATTCPECQTPREGWLAAATETPDLGAAALEDAESVLQDARLVVNFYRLRDGGVPEGMRLPEALDIVLGIVSYKVERTNGVVSDAPISIEDDELLIRDASRGRDRSRIVERIPLWSILAAAGVSGRITLHRAGTAPVVIRNRGGLLASRPRPDHYRVLGRWLALRMATAAERRWSEIGPAAHAAEIGVESASPAAPASRYEDGPAAGPEAVAAALGTLDGLRAQGLVTDDEYVSKRREILDRI